jgi:PAS domain S-box-containing protein
VDLRRIFDLSLDLMVICDMQGRFRTVSASATKILGYTPQELVGRRFMEFVHPDDVERTHAAHEALIRGSDVVEFENRYVRKDGTIIDLNWSASWYADAGFSYSIARDVTMRKRAEAQREAEHQTLQMSLVRLELAQSIARLGYWERDLLNDRTVVYGETRSILGLPADQGVDIASVARQVVEEDQHLFLAGYVDANRGMPRPMQYRIRRPDGTVRHIYTERRAIRDANGKPVRVIGTLQDVTERHESDVERQRYITQLSFLADAARKLNSLLTTDELLQVVTDIARDLIDAHIAHGRLQTGSGDLECRSRSVKYSLSDADPATRAPTLDVALTTAAGRRIGSIQVWERRPGSFTQGDERALVQLADLAAIGLENARLYGELEERVRSRTRELEQSNRELEAFSYSVSHDLRGPLRAIAGFTGLLRERHYDTMESDSRRYLDRIVAGTQRMSSLIDDLLELGRVTRVELKRELVDLSAVVQGIVNRMVEAAPERDTAVTIEPDHRAQCDLRLMEIALENLLDNAWKFTATRRPTQIRFGATAGADGSRVFFLQDNGVGFDPRYAANLFGVFERLHAPSEYPGTGVGLATVQRIVHRHGGRIWAEAEVDRGATFYFTLATVPATL